jgi:hypothetical protein
VRSAPLAVGGTVLGHEVLVPDIGCSFNRPESLHTDEQDVLRDASVFSNSHGLIDSLDEALAWCRLLEPDASGEQGRRAGWPPWLMVRYWL